MMPAPWICPRCQVVHAPHVDRCNCAPRPQYLPLGGGPHYYPPLAPPFIPTIRYDNKTTI